MSVYKVTNEHFDVHDIWENDWYKCPNCGFDSLDIGFRYCPACGEGIVFDFDEEE